MRPCWLDFIFLLDSGFRELEVGLFEVRKWSENVFLNHGHHIIEVRNNEGDNCFLVLKQLLDFIDSVQSFGLSLDILGLVLVVVGLLADKKLLLELLFGILIGWPSCVSLSWSGIRPRGLG